MLLLEVVSRKALFRVRSEENTKRCAREDEVRSGCGALATTDGQSTYLSMNGGESRGSKRLWIWTVPLPHEYELQAPRELYWCGGCYPSTPRGLCIPDASQKASAREDHGKEPRGQMILTTRVAKMERRLACSSLMMLSKLESGSFVQRKLGPRSAGSAADSKVVLPLRRERR